MPLCFEFSAKQDALISFYFLLRILNATWHMVSSERLFCHFLDKQITVTNALLEAGVWRRHKKKNFLLTQLPSQHCNYFPIAVNASKWHVLLQLISMEQQHCPWGGHCYAASSHHSLDYRSVQNAFIKSIETSTLRAINTTQSGHSYLMRIALTTVNLGVDHYSEKQLVNLPEREPLPRGSICSLKLLHPPLSLTSSKLK